MRFIFLFLLIFCGCSETTETSNEIPKEPNNSLSVAPLNLILAYNDSFTLNIESSNDFYCESNKRYIADVDCDGKIKSGAYDKVGEQAVILVKSGENKKYCVVTVDENNSAEIYLANKQKRLQWWNSISEEWQAIFEKNAVGDESLDETILSIFKLQELIIDNSSLTSIDNNIIDQFLKNLTNLQRIIITNNLYLQSVKLNKQKKLTKVIINNNYYLEKININENQSLEDINIADNAYLCEFSCYNCEKMSYLNADNNMLKKLNFNKNILKELSANNNIIDSFPSQINKKSLIRLSLRSNKIKNIPENIKFETLKELDLGDNIIEGSFLDLNVSDSLEILDLSSNNFSHFSLNYSNNLKDVMIDYNKSLSYIALTGNAVLKKITLRGNVLLKNCSFSENSLLREINAAGCSELALIDITNSPILKLDLENSKIYNESSIVGLKESSNIEITFGDKNE